MSRTGDRGRLKPVPSFATVPPMPSRRAPRQPLRARQRRKRSVQRARRIVGLVFLTSILLVTLLLTAFGNSPSSRLAVAAKPAAVSPLPAGPPRPQVIAMQGSLPLQLPVPQERLTAIGYHAAATGALPLDPLGRRANEGALTRIVRRVFGGGEGRLRYFQLAGGQGPGTAVLNVGAAAGTEVYSPVDGVVVGMDDFVLDGRRYGDRVELQPAGAPSVIVSVTRLRADPSLRVGSSVSGSTSKLGTLLDLSRVEEQSLARYTHDAGNHVSIEVHPAATLSLP